MKPLDWLSEPGKSKEEQQWSGNEKVRKLRFKVDDEVEVEVDDEVAALLAWLLVGRGGCSLITINYHSCPRLILIS